MENFLRSRASQGGFCFILFVTSCGYSQVNTDFFVMNLTNVFESIHRLCLLKVVQWEVATSLQRAQRGRLRLKCDSTRAETRLCLSTKRASPFKSAGASVQSTTGRRAVRISLQSLHSSCEPVFCSHVTLTGYPLRSLVSPSLLLPCVYRVPSHFNWTLLFSFPLSTWRRRRRLQDDVLLINTDNGQCLNP